MIAGSGPRRSGGRSESTMGHCDVMADVVIVGAGAIGLGIAWKAAAGGAAVTVVDPSPGSGASDVAAGMIAPVTELTYGEEALGALSAVSAERYESFVEELQQAAGEDVGYRRCGTLTVALDRDDLALLDDVRGFLEARSLPVTRLTGRDARSRQQLLAPELSGALLVEGDHQVHPQRLVAALRHAAERAGVAIVRAAVTRLLMSSDRVSGVVTDTGDIAAHRVVVAAGAWSASLTAGIDDAPVRPVKGQLLVLQTADRGRFLSTTVRGLAHGFAVYVVSRDDGRVIVGATVEERGFDTSVTADAVYTLLRDGRRLIPALTELDFVEVRAGLRPGTPDNAPILGEGAVPGLIWATGHYRNGILLTPVTADAIASLVIRGAAPTVIAPFSSRRFARGKVVV